MMKVVPYLLFNGQCEAAFQFYAKRLGGTIEVMMPHEGTPAAEHLPPEWLKKVLHARLRLGDTILLASDCPPDRYHKPEGFSVALLVKQPAEAERVFRALAENGTVRMPMQETFWSPRFGMLVDQFAIPWIIYCEPPA